MPRGPRSPRHPSIRPGPAPVLVSDARPRSVCTTESPDQDCLRLRIVQVTLPPRIRGHPDSSPRHPSGPAVTREDAESADARSRLDTSASRRHRPRSRPRGFRNLPLRVVPGGACRPAPSSPHRGLRQSRHRCDGTHRGRARWRPHLRYGAACPRRLGAVGERCAARVARSQRPRAPASRVPVRSAPLRGTHPVRCRGRRGRAAAPPRLRGRRVVLRLLRVCLAAGTDRAGIASPDPRRSPRSARWLVDFARPDADSGLESLLRLRLHLLGISLATQVSIPGVGRVDFVVDGHLIIEVDGREHHGAPEMRHRDLSRDAAASRLGYETLRFDYAQVVHDWPTVQAAIRGALRRARDRI